MDTLPTLDINPSARTDWPALAATLGQTFNERAPEIDAQDLFVAENYEDLKAHRFFSAGVPLEFGGAGLAHEQLGAILRELGRHCASTALAFAMHTHQAAIAAWRWRQQKAPVDGLLKRVAAEQIVLLSSGGSDWLHGSGAATRVDGGYRLNARKVFASGAPIADLFLTSAVVADPETGPTVLHFAVSMKAPGVQILPTWKSLGMCGTGSHDVLLQDVFIEDKAIVARRPQGVWHPMFHVVSTIAIPLIYAVYVGIAEAARDIAVGRAKFRCVDAHTVALVGRLDNELEAARLALDAMFATAASHAPGPMTTNRIMVGRTLVARSVLAAVDLALEAAGGGAFYRDLGLERRFRDAQGARFHPMQSGAQHEFAGRIALGLDIDAPAGQVRSNAA